MKTKKAVKGVHKATARMHITSHLPIASCSLPHHHNNAHQHRHYRHCIHRSQRHRLFRALLLDRDGVINVDKGYLHRIEDCELIPAIFKIIRAAKARGYKVIVVTNQSGIARGIFTEQQYFVLRRHIHAELARHGCAIDAEYYCPYHPDGLGIWQRDSIDRKPQPGMLLRAAREHRLDLAHSIMIGDQMRDLEAAKRAGVQRRFLVNHHNLALVCRILGWPQH